MKASLTSRALRRKPFEPNSAPPTLFSWSYYINSQAIESHSLTSNASRKTHKNCTFGPTGHKRVAIHNPVGKITGRKPAFSIHAFDITIGLWFILVFVCVRGAWRRRVSAYRKHPSALPTHISPPTNKTTKQNRHSTEANSASTCRSERDITNQQTMLATACILYSIYTARCVLKANKDIELCPPYQKKVYSYS